MKQLSPIFLFLFLGIHMQSLQAQKKKISIDDLWVRGVFAPAYVEGFNFKKDGGYYTRLIDRGQEIKEYNLSTGQPTRSLYVANKEERIMDYGFSSDEEKILLTYDIERIYRHSYKANFKVWDSEKKELISISDKDKQRYATFNEQGDKLAYLRENDLYYFNLESKKETQITSDGKHNHIINGASDWVYEEEFGIDKTFFWSPNGEYIAFLRFDESLVKEFRLTYYTGELYPVESSFKYPKAGELNAVVSVQLYELKTGKTKEIKVKGDIDQYIPRLSWSPDNKLCITRINRHQNELALLFYKPQTEETETIIEEKSETYIDIHDQPVFVDDKSFVWMSDRDGYMHLYLYELGKKKVKVRQITEGKFDVSTFYGVDKEEGMAYFQGAISSPINREIARASIKSSKLEILSKEVGSNSAQFSKDYKFMVLAHSSAASPGSHSIYNIEKEPKLLRTIEDNSSLMSVLQQYEFGRHEFFKVPNGEGDSLNAWRILPPNFDSTKSYPLFMYVYGGPGAQTVLNSWDSRNHIWFQMLAQEGYVVVSVDNRGTGARGSEFKKSTYLQLGKLEAKDQTYAAQYLGSLKYIDAKRIGIFGWSFGGYLSTLCLAKGAAVFKLAIAVAPVINWKWYDTIYTERYMRTPQENEDGYEQNSPINFADKIKGSYLLVHGTTDDNVHFQNATEMSNALIEKNIPFEQAFYPNRNHGIYGGYTRAHLYNKMTRFVLENL